MHDCQKFLLLSLRQDCGSNNEVTNCNLGPVPRSCSLARTISVISHILLFDLSG